MLMKNTLAFVFVAIVLSSVTVRGQEQMTVARFREIASTSGDSVPLNPRLTAGGPLWTNATIAISLKYANGTNFNEVVSETCLLYTSDAADDLLCVDLGG